MSRDKDQVVIKQNVPKVKKSQTEIQMPSNFQKKSCKQAKQLESKMCLEMGKQANKQTRCLDQDVGMRYPIETSVGACLGRISGVWSSWRKYITGSRLGNFKRFTLFQVLSLYLLLIVYDMSSHPLFQSQCLPAACCLCYTIMDYNPL